MNYLFCAPVGRKTSTTPPCFNRKISDRACHRAIGAYYTIMGGGYSTLFSVGCRKLALIPIPPYTLMGAMAVALAVPVVCSAHSAYRSCRAAKAILKNGQTLQSDPMPNKASPHKASSGHWLASGMALTAGACTAGLMLFSITNPAAGMLYLQSRFVLPTIAHMALQGLSRLTALHLEGRAKPLMPPKGRLGYECFEPLKKCLHLNVPAQIDSIIISIIAPCKLC